jgi:hypothetical protein
MEANVNMSYRTRSLENLLIQVSESVLHQPLDGESVLLDIASGKYFGLNELGSHIWTLLKQGHTLPEIIELLLDEYSVTREKLLEDIWDFILQLEVNGMISIVDNTNHG